MRKNPLAKRCIAGAAAMSVLLLGLEIRLYGLCGGETLRAAAQSQQTRTVIAGSARGTIYDCNRQPLTNRRWEPACVVTGAPRALAALNGYEDGEAVRTQLQSGKPATVIGWSAEADGIASFAVPVRYSDPCAVHLIGYTDGSGAGVCGIEQSYDEILTEYSGTVEVHYTADAWGRSLNGDAPEVENTLGRSVGGVMLTIDRTIQQMAERVASEMLPMGAIVILDVQTGKIRALVSTPTYDPDHVAAALNADGSPLLNRALCAYNVGSVFKPVVSACALESGIPDEPMICTGVVQYGGRSFQCIHGVTHGAVNLTRAIAVSCNGYFIRLIERMGASPVRALAEKFGFGQPLWLAGTVAGAAGQLPTPENLQAPAAAANFAFGQGDLTATPLQIASMMQTIANGGIRIAPSVVECTVNAFGVCTPESDSRSERVLNAHTAAQVQRQMIEAVKSGTAQSAAPTDGGAGAKTATAETGMVSDGEAVIHAWCAGFYPAENPQYAIAVFAENGRSGSGICAPIFKCLADGLQLDPD